MKIWTRTHQKPSRTDKNLHLHRSKVNLQHDPTAFRRQFFHQRTQPPSTPGISSRVPNAQRVDPTPCEDLTWATREEPFGRRNGAKKTGHKMRSKWRICLDIDWHPRIPQSILHDWKWKTWFLSCVIWCGKSTAYFATAYFLFQALLWEHFWGESRGKVFGALCSNSWHSIL